MSRLVHAHDADEVGFPRVSGDEPESEMTNTYLGTFSPRERG